MHSYLVTATFTTDTELTDEEIGALADRVSLEIAEPQAEDGDGLPNDARWGGAAISVNVARLSSDRIP